MNYDESGSMSDRKHDEFRVLVKAAHDAIDEFAEALMVPGSQWFERNLDDAMLRAVQQIWGLGRCPAEPRGPVE